MYLPEFANMKVMIHEDTGELEHAKPITVRHLLTHTAGLTYAPYRHADRVAKMYYDAGVFGVCYQGDAESLEDWARKLAKQPLIAQPGTKWRYSVAMDVLGRLVEVWSGKPFDVFLQERVFKPLAMHDTGFHVPTEKHVRIGPLYGDGESGELAVLSPGTEEYLSPAKFPMGGSGLVSTPCDFYRFAQVLLSGGQLEGVRVSSPRTVDLMTRDQLPRALGPNPLANLLGDEPDAAEEGNANVRTDGFGFAGQVRLDPVNGKTVLYSWGGAAGTFCVIFPQEDMAVLFFTQKFGPSFRIQPLLEVLAIQAITD